MPLGHISFKDCVADVDAVAAAIAERSVREEEERRRHAKQLEDLEWRQVVAAVEALDFFGRLPKKVDAARRFCAPPRAAGAADGPAP